MAEKETRNFTPWDEKGNDIGVFTGRSLRQAALKAANRGHMDIRLRGSVARRRCTYSQARECRWTCPRVRLPGCSIRSGSPWLRKWARISRFSVEASLSTSLKQSIR